jgi:hypothetical protein
VSELLVTPNNLKSVLHPPAELSITVQQNKPNFYFISYWLPTKHGFDRRLLKCGHPTIRLPIYTHTCVPGTRTCKLIKRQPAALCENVLHEHDLESSGGSSASIFMQNTTRHFGVPA